MACCARQAAWTTTSRGSSRQLSGRHLRHRLPTPSARPVARTCVAQLSAVDEGTARRRRLARFTELSSLASCAALVACGAPRWLSHSALLLVEGAYVSLHAFPLLPLVTQPLAARFMAVYTTPRFFLSELVLYALLYIATPVPHTVWPAAFAAHVAAHVLYAGITGLFPEWALRQNVRRVTTHGGSSPLVAAWDVLLNILNAWDAAMHCLYACVLMRLLPAPAAVTLLVLAAAGTMLACSPHVQ
jgi:hypothetical protein